MPIKVTGASKAEGVVEVTFSDGAGYTFHSLWLRDAATETHDVDKTCEKVIEKTPVVAGCGRPFPAEPKAVGSTDDGDLEIEWQDGDPITKSVFKAAWLRAYATLAAKPHADNPASAAAVPDDFFSFLENGTGQKREGLQLWDAQSELTRFAYDDLCKSLDLQLEMMERLMDRGAVFVTGMPDDPKRDASVLGNFAQAFFGGLQKHPLRQTANWTISTEDLTQFGGNDGSVAQVSGYKGIERTTRAYDTNLQIQQHTDQSAYGTPGLLLMFHCADGQGGNTVTDGFKVAYQMKEQFPEEFKMLSTKSYNLGRRIEHYAAGMQLQIEQPPIIQLDDEGNIVSIRYHELYRSAFTLPFEDFQAYYKALGKFYELVHSPENMKRIQLHKGECIIMNNWRTMHGRAGLAGKRRTILGGTVSQPSFLSQLRLLKETLNGLGAHETLGTPIHLFQQLKKHKA